MEMVNGLGNRFVYVWSEIGTFLPFGGTIDRVAVAVLADRFSDAAVAALDHPSINGTRPYRLSDGARELWTSFYRAHRLGVGDSEVSRGMTARQVAHAARIGLLYAVLDGADTIGETHFRAAIAWCDYSLGTIRKVFADSVGGRPGQLLAAIRETGIDGLDGTRQHALFSNHLAGHEIERLRAVLEDDHLIFTATIPTGGRMRKVSFAIWPDTTR